MAMVFGDTFGPPGTTRPTRWCCAPADQLAGPWTAEQVVVTAEQAPALYAPYFPPQVQWSSGPAIYFALSQFGPCNVFWWRTSLDRKSSAG